MVLPSSCFTEQLSIPEYTNKCSKDIFFSLSEVKTQKMNTQESKERKFVENLREKG